MGVGGRPPLAILPATSWAAFPGVNGRIAFVSNRSGRADIYKMHPDGSHTRRLTRDPAEDTYPDISPDGKRIVYVRRHNHNSTIYLMDADGSHQRRLTKKRGWELDPSFSADGNQVIYSADRPDGSDLYLINTDGSHRHLLVHHPGNDWGATYSPNGAKIAFENTAADISIFVMNGDGTRPRDLTDHPPGRLCRIPGLLTKRTEDHLHPPGPPWVRCLRHERRWLRSAPPYAQARTTGRIHLFA